MPAPHRDRPAQFGADERYDRIAHRLRLAAWGVIVPSLVAAALLWQSPGAAVGSVVLRALLIYGFVLLVMRIAGKRTLAELSPFDLVVILIISEGIQPALTADDNRMTTGILLVLTIAAADAFLGLLKDRSRIAARLLDDVPTVLVYEGKPVAEAMERERIDEDDILEAARERLGLESMEQVRFAILERTGGISVIPWDGPRANPRSR